MFHLAQNILLGNSLVLQISMFENHCWEMKFLQAAVLHIQSSDLVNSDVGGSEYDSCVVLM